MRNILRTSAVLALGMLGGLAAASDYIVARSTDASIVKGTALAAGAVVPAAAMMRLRVDAMALLGGSP